MADQATFRVTIDTTDFERWLATDEGKQACPGIWSLFTDELPPREEIERQLREVSPVLADAYAATDEQRPSLTTMAELSRLAALHGVRIVAAEPLTDDGLAAMVGAWDGETKRRVYRYLHALGERM